MLEFSRENDAKMKKMADRGADFVERHLRMKDVEDYWFKILNKYAKLSKWKPVKDETLVEIKKRKSQKKY